MGTYEFLSVFEYILTDRGSEFGDPVALETGLDEIQRTSIYYCDPMRSGQKEVLSRLTPCFAWCFPKELVLIFDTMGCESNRESHQLHSKGKS